ncbi:unnamed protein product [Hapterophycus canaliculatus]
MFHARVAGAGLHQLADCVRGEHNLSEQQANNNATFLGRGCVQAQNERTAADSRDDDLRTLRKMTFLSALSATERSKIQNSTCSLPLPEPKRIRGVPEGLVYRSIGNNTAQD